jgi:hypothetical protein
MFSLENRIRLASVFDRVAREERLTEKILGLIMARHEEGLAQGTLLPPPPRELRVLDLSPETFTVWSPVWARAHELVCAQAKEAGVLGQIHLYLAASRMWGEAVDRFAENVTLRPASAPVLRVIDGYKKA